MKIRITVIMFDLDWLPDQRSDIFSGGVQIYRLFFLLPYEIDQNIFLFVPFLRQQICSYKDDNTNHIQ